jgi:hypothetical protein
MELRETHFILSFDPEAGSEGRKGKGTEVRQIEKLD